MIKKMRIEEENARQVGIQFSVSEYLMGIKHNVQITDSRETSGLGTEKALDAEADRPNHTAMTDINRQQVADMLSASEAKVDARLANFDTSIKTGFADVKTGFAELKTEMQKMRADFEKQSHDSTKWIIGSVFGMISLGVAIIGVMINLNKGEKPPSAPQSGTVVITVPGATVAPVQAPVPQPATK